MATVTPFVKRMRIQGGTIYTFSSALEDIGLNINERNNIVKMSQFALLNIPSIDEAATATQNKFNLFAIPGAYEYLGASVKSGTLIVAESFQNYALNLETNILAGNAGSYNPSLQTTISERVFWKWLKETGAIRWTRMDTSAGMYWMEEADASGGYNSVVKCVGNISAGAVRTGTFGTYNETYVLVPTSYGRSPVYFKQVEDDNYYHGLSIPNGEANILGREGYTDPHPDGLDIRAFYDVTATNTYNVDTSAYIASGPYYVDYTSPYTFRRSTVDCMSIEFNIQTLRTIFNDNTLTFDKLAIEYAEDDVFDFNAVLLYYSVYNKALDALLATNLLGILFLDPPSGNTQNFPTNEIVMPYITKIQSGPTGFGTSYSFRLNIKSDYMIDDTAADIYDESTSSQQNVETVGELFDVLNKTLTILNQQTGTINYITQQYMDLTMNNSNMLNSISDLQYKVNDISRDIVGTDGTIPMFANGDDPIIDSSIYMYNGKVGIFNSQPTEDFEVAGDIKVENITINNTISDEDGNVILGINAPQLKLGDWIFDTSGTMLRLSYDGTVTHVFSPDGSIYNS